jgi:hypothetical protein
MLTEHPSSSWRYLPNPGGWRWARLRDVSAFTVRHLDVDDIHLATVTDFQAYLADDGSPR